MPPPLVLLLIFRAGKRKVQRVAIQLPLTPSIEAYWMWSESPGRFVPYDIDASVDIELAFQRRETQVDLTQKPSKLPYTIDLTNLYQTRHYYNTKRAIQRAPLPAGVSLQQLLVSTPTASSTGSGVHFIGSGSGLVSGPSVGPYHAGSGATSRSGSGLASRAAPHYGSGTMPGATSRSGSGFVLGAAPYHGSGPMPTLNPNPHGSGATALTGYTSSSPYYPGPPAGHTHSTTSPGMHLGYLGHTPLPPSSAYTSHSISSGTTSKSSTPSLATHHSSTTILGGSSSRLLSNPPTAATKSKAKSRMTVAKSTPPSAPRTAASVPKKSSGKSSGKIKSRAKTEVAPTSAGDHGGGSDLSTYARRVTKLRTKSDEVSEYGEGRRGQSNGFGCMPPMLQMT